VGVEINSDRSDQATNSIKLSVQVLTQQRYDYCVQMYRTISKLLLLAVYRRAADACTVKREEEAVGERLCRRNLEVQAVALPTEINSCTARKGADCT